MMMASDGLRPQMNVTTQSSQCSVCCMAQSPQLIVVGSLRESLMPSLCRPGVTAIPARAQGPWIGKHVMRKEIAVAPDPLETAFTALAGCRLPIQIAPMGAISTPALVAAGAEAGAFPMIGTAAMSADDVHRSIDRIRELTDLPIGANVLMPFADPAIVASVAERVRIFDFYHGAPEAGLVRIVHDAGALASWQVGSLDEAMRAADAGCDLLAARGTEGGGRMHGDLPLLPLLNAVLDRVDLPVVAAGGLATGRDLAAMLAAGAAGVRLGTRFVATVESGAHPMYKQALVDAGAADTVLVDDFSVMWPNGPQPHRVLRRSLDAARSHTGDTVGTALVFGERRPLPRFCAVPPTIGTEGSIEAMVMYAGTSVGCIDDIRPAAMVIDEIASGARACLRRR